MVVLKKYMRENFISSCLKCLDDPHRRDIFLFWIENFAKRSEILKNFFPEKFNEYKESRCCEEGKYKKKFFKYTKRGSNTFIDRVIGLFGDALSSIDCDDVAFPNTRYRINMNFYFEYIRLHNKNIFFPSKDKKIFSEMYREDISNMSKLVDIDNKSFIDIFEEYLKKRSFVKIQEISNLSSKQDYRQLSFTKTMISLAIIISKKEEMIFMEEVICKEMNKLKNKKTKTFFKNIIKEIYTIAKKEANFLT